MASTGEEVERQQGELLSAYVYDDEGRLTQHRVHQSRIKDIAAQRDYQYDPNGNLKAIQDSRKGLREYVYDPMDRLVGVRGDLYEQLIHDPAGNLLEQSQSSASGNTANVRGNRLTMHGDCHYEYDDFGNLAEERRGKDQKLITRYTYDCEHRLTSVTKPDGSTWHYEYDAFGRRIAKTNGLTRTEFLWQGDRLIAEETGDQYRTYIYEPDTFKPLALVEGYGKENATPYYYHLDHLGTPQEITNAEGDLVWSVTYRAYGNVVRALVQDIDNPLRFQGQYHDTETGLHYNRHRYYNPNTGRFMTPDPIGLAGGLNNYQYVPNPTGWVDPLGLAVRSKDEPDSGANAGWGKYATAIDDKVTVVDKNNSVPEWMRETFMDSHYRTVVTNEDITLYRVFGGTARPQGAFATTMPAGNRIQSKIDSALLPEWKNSREYEAEIIIPKGTKLDIGKVAPQTIDETGTVLKGGADQVLLPRDWPDQWIVSISSVRP
jgi:RHS repeat-associated protein